MKSLSTITSLNKLETSFKCDSMPINTYLFCIFFESLSQSFSVFMKVYLLSLPAKLWSCWLALDVYDYYLRLNSYFNMCLCVRIEVEKSVYKLFCHFQIKWVNIFVFITKQISWGMLKYTHYISCRSLYKLTKY